MQTAAFLPMWLSPSARPTEVVDLPSPSGVGVIAVTSDVLAARPFGLEAADALERDLGLGRSVELELVVRDAEIVGDVRDRTRRDASSDLEVGREAHRSPPEGTGWAGVAEDAADDCVDRGLAFRGADQVGQQDGVGERTDPSRYRRDGRCDLDRRGEVDVTDDVAVDDVDAHIDDDRARLEHGARDEARPAGGHDHDVGPGDVGGEVGRAGVADGDRRVLPDQQERGGHPHDRGPSDDDGVAAGDLDPRTAQDLDRGVGGRGQEAVIAETQQAGVEGMDAVDVLVRVDGVDDRLGDGSSAAAASGR